MRVLGGKFLGFLAIYAIVLHTALWAVAAPLAAGQNADPLAVICHGGPAAIAGEQTPASPASAPASACDHCNLCNAAPLPAALDDVLAGVLAPAKQPPVRAAAEAALRDSQSGNPHNARGPPQLT
jgi:hypothetical protein